MFCRSGTPGVGGIARRGSRGLRARSWQKWHARDAIAVARSPKEFYRRYMTLQPDVKYTATATAQGGREGHVRSADGLIDLDMRPPAELGGPGGTPNPELLFAAGYASCFQEALGLAGKSAGVDTSNSVVTAHVGIGPEGESFALAVTMEVTIPGQDADTTKKLTERAHELCPYSKATRGNVEVTLRPQTA